MESKETSLIRKLSLVVQGAISPCIEIRKLLGDSEEKVEQHPAIIDARAALKAAEEYLSSTKRYSSNLKLQHTERGFAFVNFTDSNGIKCSLQESSSQNPAIWLGADDIGLKEFIAFRQPNAWESRPEFDKDDPSHHFIANNRMHLRPEVVKELLPLLHKFVEEGEIE